MASYFKRVCAYEVMSNFTSVQSFPLFKSQKIFSCNFLYVFLIFPLSRAMIVSTVAHNPLSAIPHFHRIPLRTELLEDIIHLMYPVSRFYDIL